MYSVHSNGLELTLATRRLSGPLVPGRHPHVAVVVNYLVRAPAVVLMGLLLVAPALYTVGLGALTHPGLALGCGLQLFGGGTLLIVDRRRLRTGMAALPSLFAFTAWVFAAALGLGCLAAGSLVVWRQLPRASRSAYLHTAGWVALAIVLVGVALVLAWPSRRLPWLWWPFIVPFGVSAFTPGIAFRLILETVTRGRYFSSVAAERYAFEAVLVAAFVWTWLGLLVGLFRAAILAIEDDPVRAPELAGGPRWLMPIRLWTQVRPVASVAFLVVAVAAARVFDAVLGAVPRSLQHDVGTATVEWWRLNSACEANSCGEAAAYALPLTAALVLAALFAQDRINVRRPSGPRPLRPRPSAWREHLPLWRAIPRWLLVGVAVLVVLSPIGELVYVALHGTVGPKAVGVPAVTIDPALRDALRTTLTVAVPATVMVVAFALPVAHWLAAARVRIAVPCLVILTVLPAQMYLGALQRVIGSSGWFGSAPRRARGERRRPAARHHGRDGNTLRTATIGEPDQSGRGGADAAGALPAGRSPARRRGSRHHRDARVAGRARSAAPQARRGSHAVGAGARSSGTRRGRAPLVRERGAPALSPPAQLCATGRTGTGTGEQHPAEPRSRGGAGSGGDRRRAGHLVRAHRTRGGQPGYGRRPARPRPGGSDGDDHVRDPIRPAACPGRNPCDGAGAATGALQPVDGVPQPARSRPAPTGTGGLGHHGRESEQGGQPPGTGVVVATARRRRR
ncbi:hypothetical protein [Nocardia sp. NPDC059229]|uniref:hypothetical protein n=1 Tax=Nocardia sp. NPDC059229 TaxID=3346778 RepID=UPI00368F1614